MAYVRELSRFADVYYLADCDLEAGELEKLAPYTKQRWAIRHGRYDFGSYSMLARDLVGWDEIATYDELLLANDSAYLLRPLDEVFATMDARPAHWWGLQATDDDFTPGEQKRLGRRLRVDDLVTEGRTTRPWRTSDCFHVGSYFLALRSEVVADPEFRRRLDMVAVQSQKELDHQEVRDRHLAVPDAGRLPRRDLRRRRAALPPHLPRVGPRPRGGQGFPLLKRQFLHENPFHVPDLHRMEGEGARGGSRTPTSPRWSRTSGGSRPRSTCTVPSRPSGPTRGGHPTEELIGPDNWYELEQWVPRFDHWWAFPVDPRTGRLDGHARAVFEEVRHDPAIKKVLIGPTESPGLGGANVATVRAETQAAQWYLLRAGTILVTEGPRVDAPHPLVPDEATAS